MLATHGWGQTHVVIIGTVQMPMHSYPCTVHSTFHQPHLIPGTVLVCIRYFSCLLFAETFLVLVGLVFVSLSLHCVSSNKISVKYMDVCLIVYSSIHYHKYISRTFHLRGSVLDRER